MGRSPCCSKEGLNRGAWTAHEDKILTDYIRVHGEGRWRNLPKRAGLKRCGKSCRLRWLNYLRPDIKRGNISPDEEELIIRLHKLLGNRWSLIAGRLPGRTDNEIKNYWNTNLGKKIKDHHQSTASRKLSSTTQQPNQKKNSKIPNKKTSFQPAPPPNVESQKLIRTKATKCSKIFIDPRPQISTQLQNNSKPQSEAEEPVIKDSANQISEPASNENGLLSFKSEEQDREQEQALTSDLLDSNMGEIWLSDLMNLDFSDVRDFSFSYSNNNSDEPSPSTEHQPLVFSDEMFQDWTQSNFAETNVGSNLQSLASFLGSSEELLEEE